MNDFTSVTEKNTFAKAGPMPDYMPLTKMDLCLHKNMLINRLRVPYKDLIEMEARFLNEFYMG